MLIILKAVTLKVDSTLKEVPIGSIVLDKNNPRFRFSKIERGLSNWDEEVIEEEIRESLVFNKLLDSIKQYGVIDPIWLHELRNGKYEVVEGNMRVTALRTLLRNSIKH